VPSHRIAFVLLLAACGAPDGGDGTVHDPDTAPVVAIDRFSEDAGTLQVRDGENGLPGPDEPIDMDQPPFVTRGLGPDGGRVRYYNLDVQPVVPQMAWILQREGEDAPVEGQLPIVARIPGELGYGDFWQVHRVTVPADYRANALADADAVMSSGFPIVATEEVLNRPLVPAGSTASERWAGGAVALERVWVGGAVAHAFVFDEAPIPLVGASLHYSEIYVCFNVNPDQPDGGPASGFCAEPDGQTNNVVATLPGDAAYSPLWGVNAYDNAAFDTVVDLPTAIDADLVGVGLAMVNCPVAAIDP
jgi:hypothetical protein